MASSPPIWKSRENIQYTYLVWPMRFDLHACMRNDVRKCYAAVSNATLDALYHYYFQKELCPVGTAGENCELPCDPNHGSANARGVCVCESNKWTGVDCSLEVPENTNMIPPTLKWIAYTMLGINLAVMVLCAIWLFWQKDSTQVRISQPFFLALVLVGAPCRLHLVALFAKIRRVYGIFKSAATPGTARKISVTFQETIAVIGLVLLDIAQAKIGLILVRIIAALALACGDGVLPLLCGQKYPFQVFGIQVFEYCHDFQSSVACKNAPKVLTNNMMKHLNGTRNDLAVVLLIFGNLIYNAHFHLEAAEPEAVKAAIGQAIQSFSTTRESRRISRLSSQFTSTTAYSPGVNSSFQGSGQVSMNGSAHLFTNNQPTQILQQSDREKDPKRRSTNKNSSISSAKEITLTQERVGGEQLFVSAAWGTPTTAARFTPF
ncbi:unknown protein [Seminavis robusta]|uniref:Uncharacterized protein n=1 Tax=Seminavis robusta TaxID=568900 RepID=A0A9N8HE05_9STRA|nr:unknown protein [Seminavis robusta]|eukprot:Sro384_g131460.1 n/a (434) ;mRNA; r:27629-29505